MTDPQAAPQKPAATRETSSRAARNRAARFSRSSWSWWRWPAFFIWRGFFATQEVPANIVVLSGRIEGDDSAVAPKTTGRILEIRVREGDTVKAGDTIAVLDDAQLTSREEQARAALTGAEARAKSAGDQIAVYQQQLQQNELGQEQAKVDAAGRVRQAEGDIAAAEADLAQQEASLKLAQFDNDAYQKLVKTGAASERQATQASATADQQAAAVAAARRRLDAARGALTTAQANLSNPGIHEFQGATVRKQIAMQQGRDRQRRRALQSRPGATQGSTAESQRPHHYGAFRWNGADARCRAGRSGHGGHSAGHDA